MKAISKPIHIARWILTPLSAIFGFYLSFFIGLFGVDVIYSLCPPDLVVSGTCTAQWSYLAEDALVDFGAGLAAVLVVLFPFLTAPSHRFKVAVTAYAMGALTTLWMGWDFFASALNFSTYSPDWILGRPLFSALAAGMVTVLLIRYLLVRREPPNTPKNLTVSP